MSNKFKNNIEEIIKNFNKKSNNELNKINNEISTLNDKIFKIKYTIKNNKNLNNAGKK